MSLEFEPKHSKLTRFLCQELLFEYASGTLERRRRRDVENYLAGCRDTQRELDNLKKGMAYANSVSTIQVSPSLHQALHGHEPAWKKRLQAMTLWSSQRGWRLLPAIFLVLAVALGLAVTKPWKTERRQDTILAEQRQNESTPTEGALSKASPMELAKVEDAEEQPTQKEESIPGIGKGLIYRGEVTVKFFATTWPAIRDKIVELQGKVAGSVELGWLRHPNESYFHFTVPESHLAELETYLKSFGPVRIGREHHPRVMPKGQIRIILTVKDGEPHESAAEAP